MVDVLSEAQHLLQIRGIVPCPEDDEEERRLGSVLPESIVY
jgi:hypothetical protein